MSGSRSGSQSFIIQIILAVVASSLLVTLFSTIYGDFLKRPYIVSQVFREGFPKPNNYIVDIRNNGLEPAKNLTVSITTPKPILYPVNHFSTEKINFTEYGDDFIVLNADRFSQGKGSLIRVVLGINTTSQNYTDYSTDYSNQTVVYSTYDQGSNISGEPIDIIHQAIFAVNVGNNYLAAVVIGAIIAYLGVILYIVFLRRRREKEFVLRVKGDITRINDILNDNPKFKGNFYKPYSIFGWFREWRYWKVKTRTFAKMQDYYQIHNFYKKVKEREEYISKNKHLQDNDENLAKLNTDCRILSQWILLKIDWTKYINQ